MGIKGLMKIISANAPDAIKEQEMKNYFGRKIAVDASMSLYQFLIAVRSGPDGGMLTNENGEVTSHLQGMFYRTIRMLNDGVKPCYVFDGSPPELKKGELEHRRELRKNAEKLLQDAKDQENQEDMNKFSKRLVRVSKDQNAEAQKLLRLMGVPVVMAPGEAEATCAALCKGGHVYASATEDMDCLTFGTTKLVRHMTFSAARKMPIIEIDLQKVLEGLNFTMDQFVDLCIMCGCDYTTTIRGIGGVRALSLMKEHKSTEEILKKLDTKKYTIPEDFLHAESKALFIKPDVVDVENIKLKWKDPDEKGIIEFLVNEKGFQLERVQSGLKRLKAARGKSSQKRMESFFTVKPSTTKKRKVPPAKGKGKGKAKNSKKAKGKKAKK